MSCVAHMLFFLIHRKECVPHIEQSGRTPSWNILATVLGANELWQEESEKEETLRRHPRIGGGICAYRSIVSARNQSLKVLPYPIDFPINWTSTFFHLQRSSSDSLECFRNLPLPLISAYLPRKSNPILRLPNTRNLMKTRRYRITKR